MIARGKSISHLGNSIEYAKGKHQAAEIDRMFLSGSSPSEIEKEFKLFQRMNDRCEKNSLSFVISPTIEDGKNLTNVDLKDLTRDFIAKMGLKDHQYIAFNHVEKAHSHVHVYVNRISMSGKTYNDSFLSNRSSQMAQEIAEKRGLVTAKEVSKIKSREIDPWRRKILEANTAVLRACPSSVDMYSRLMRDRGVETLIKRNNANKIIGVQFKLEEKIFKASDISRSLSANFLATTIMKGLEKVFELSR